MISKIIKILCSVIPMKKWRRSCRKKLLNMILDLTGHIEYLNDSLINEFTSANMLIKPKDSILIIAPHPDDDCIGCGGIIAKYAKQCDVMCINSSGFLRPYDTQSYEEIADMRIEEYNNVMDFLGVRKRWIWKIFGPTPHFDKIIANKNNYLKAVNFKEYNYIFVPDRLDGHREHQFLTKFFIPQLLRENGYNKKTNICYYNVWGTITNPNYFEDISSVAKIKQKALLLYKSRMQVEDNYAKRIAGLNYFYGLFINSKYAEAFRIETIHSYLKHKDDRCWAKPK